MKPYIILTNDQGGLVYVMTRHVTLFEPYPSERKTIVQLTTGAVYVRETTGMIAQLLEHSASDHGVSTEGASWAMESTVPSPSGFYCGFQRGPCTRNDCVGALCALQKELCK